MKVLVTGASGFIGTELVKKLVKTSQVVGIDLKLAKFESRNYTHIRCDCANTVEFFKACAKFDFDVEDVDIETFTDKQTQNYARPENIKKMINRYKDKLKIGNKGCIVISNASLCYRAGFMAHCFTYKKDDFINHYLHLNC